MRQKIQEELPEGWKISTIEFQKAGTPSKQLNAPAVDKLSQRLLVDLVKGCKLPYSVVRLSIADDVRKQIDEAIQSDGLWVNAVGVIHADNSEQTVDRMCIKSLVRAFDWVAVREAGRWAIIWNAPDDAFTADGRFTDWLAQSKQLPLELAVGMLPAGEKKLSSGGSVQKEIEASLASALHVQADV